jgi:hypothetical protein
MMITANRVKDFITGSVAGKAFSVPYNDEKFARMKQLIKAASDAQDFAGLQSVVDQFKPLTEESFKETVEHMTQYLHVNTSTGEYFLHKDGILSKYALPGAFVQRIVKAIETGNDLDPTIKTLVRFMRNPNYSYDKTLRFANYLNTTYVDPELLNNLMANGVEANMARERATLFQTSLTAEGLLNTYKVSREITSKFVKDENAYDGVAQKDRYDYDVDEITGLKTYQIPEYVEDRIFEPVIMGQRGDAFYCDDKPGHIIKVGSVHFLDNWDKVNCNDHNACVPGLHCGNLDYIRGYQNQGTVTHNIFVDPMDIGAFTNDGSGAIRVLRYFVHSSFAGANRGYYHSSKYAAITDQIYANMVDEAIEKLNKETEAAVNKANKDIAQINILKTF